VPLSHAVPDASASWRSPPDVCVAAVLGDALRRVAVLGGRDGMPRSLGSVYGGSVTRFLGGSVRGVVSRVIDMPGVKSLHNGVAVSRDGTTLLVSDSGFGGSYSVHVASVADGVVQRVVGGPGTAPLHFRAPSQVYVACDGFVFVADTYNKRVQVLSPDLAFHSVVGEGQLDRPAGVCATVDVIVVCDAGRRLLSTFRRSDGELVARFGTSGSGVGELQEPHSLCVMSCGRRVAVADRTACRGRVSVFTVDGAFVRDRDVGAGVLYGPLGVACSAYDELVVADRCHRCVRVFSDVGELLVTFGEGDFTGVAVHERTAAVYAQDCVGQRCVVFS
jgi:DNA-binding beta-propeller fold protein YncE